MNKVLLAGRLTRDPEMRALASGKHVTQFSVATTEYAGNGKERGEFHNVVTWDRAGLFYKLAGAFSVAGLSILGAKVISRTDHIAIDTFYVVEPGRGPVQSASAQIPRV